MGVSSIYFVENDKRGWLYQFFTKYTIFRVTGGGEGSLINILKTNLYFGQRTANDMFMILFKKNRTESTFVIYVR